MRSGLVTGKSLRLSAPSSLGTRGWTGLEKARAGEPGRHGFQTFPTIYQLWDLSKQYDLSWPQCP